MLLQRSFIGCIENIGHWQFASYSFVQNFAVRILDVSYLLYYVCIVGYSFYLQDLKKLWCNAESLVKMKIMRSKVKFVTLIQTALAYGCKTWSTLRKQFGANALSMVGGSELLSEETID